MAFKMAGFSAFTKNGDDKDIVPRSKAFVPDMIPQTELNKMGLDDLEHQREAIFNNEYEDAKSDNNTGRMKLLEGRMAKLDKLIDEKRSKIKK